VDKGAPKSWWGSRCYADPEGERKSYIIPAVKKEVVRVKPSPELVEELEDARNAVKCPHCSYEGSLRLLRTRFYDAEIPERSRCEGGSNHYPGVSPKSKRFEFVIRIRPRALGGAR